MTGNDSLELNASSINGSVAYKPQSLDLAKHIRHLQTPIRTLNPENRIISKESMYVGGLDGIEFDEYGIDGIAYVKFLKAVEECNPAEVTLLKKLSRLFREGESVDSFSIEHENKKYIQRWVVNTGDCKKRLLILDRFGTYKAYKDIHKGSFKRTDFPVILKTRIANERSIIVSNDLISELFEPLFDPLMEMYIEVVKY